LILLGRGCSTAWDDKYAGAILAEAPGRGFVAHLTGAGLATGCLFSFTILETSMLSPFAPGGPDPPLRALPALGCRLVELFP
jgi:hypothetical protein